MRVRISHRLTFEFPDAPRNLAAILRLTPRSHEGQRVSNWRIGVHPDCLLKGTEDHFGNLIHTLTVPGQTTTLDLTVQGEIATFDLAGVVRGSAERLPPDLYRRETGRTAATPKIRDFAFDPTIRADDRIAQLHNLMGAIHKSLKLEDDAVSDVALDVLTEGEGTAAGFAHLFAASARLLDYPLRCVTGYRLDPDGPSHRHAWAEALVEGFGWIGFDAVNDVCPEETYIRTAVGLDTVDAAALRCTRLDGLKETVTVQWMVKPQSAEPSQSQSQSQSQG